MKIVVLADDAGKNELMEKGFGDNIAVNYVENLTDILTNSHADAFFILKDETIIENPEVFSGKPVFINSTIEPLEELKLPENFCRINGWNGFLKREIWEVATANEEIVRNVFENLKWKYIIVADEPGLVSARIISMIINEAYFALGDDISSKNEIDIAMKLGTNYPYGPFEWSNKIGLKKIYTLLEKLNKTGKRYAIAPAMANELNN